jgi:uncharacterized protein (TIGR02466 family)
MIIHELFPTVVAEYNLDRDFTQKEIDTFYSYNKMKKNVGNLISVEKNILDKKELFDIKNKIFLCAKDYIDNILKSKTKIIPYITQSWINFTNTGEWHHKHNHNNSFLSGVLYIHCNDKLDDITFHDNNYYQIDIQSKEYTRLNSKSWNIKVANKNIFIFPSSLIHEVEKVKSMTSRVSLSFNIFIKGTIGDYDLSTELRLK